MVIDRVRNGEAVAGAVGVEDTEGVALQKSVRGIVEDALGLIVNVVEADRVSETVRVSSNENDCEPLRERVTDAVMLVRVPRQGVRSFSSFVDLTPSLTPQKINEV
eukprot:TRINITY_DN13426_c0_g1_i1.p2 TRINITY_DN13426_c0_g1~~TRINITY_DN13426_c0_g1_i1.p2  ORF type:complete len:106 (-),score=4.54 TRINITY_DN13426_c0_g1_i1:242-559(-)